MKNQVIQKINNPTMIHPGGICGKIESIHIFHLKPTNLYYTYLIVTLILCKSWPKYQG